MQATTADGETMHIDSGPSHAATPLPRRQQTRPGFVLATALLTVVISVAVCSVAVLTPAPAAVLPLVVVICVVCPILATWEAPVALARFRAERAHRAGARAVSRLRRTLDQLPEVEHPLGH
jgi:hypothetical protein